VCAPAAAIERLEMTIAGSLDAPLSLGGIQTVKALSWVNFILGLWLIVAGFTLSRGVRPVMLEEIVLGIIIACLAAAAAAWRFAAISWVVALAGLWTLLAPGAIGYGNLTASRGNDIVVGIVVLVLGIANAVFSPSPARTHA
jgi:hypothetical protein